MRGQNSTLIKLSISNSYYGCLCYSYLDVIIKFSLYVPISPTTKLNRLGIDPPTNVNVISLTSSARVSWTAPQLADVTDYLYMSLLL